MNDATTDLTPPVKTKAPNGAIPPKAAKEPKAPKVAKEPKAPKAEAAPADPNAPKKPRAPRTDYGFSPNATIEIVAGKDHGYRGQRLEWYNRISGFGGKSVSDFLKEFDNATTPKGSEDPPRGWVRFFVQEGAVKLHTAAVAQPEQAAA